MSIFDSVSMFWNGAADKNFRVSGVPGTLTVDTVDSETHDWQNDVTQYPVEEGADVSDNIRALPDEISFDCFVGGAPIKGLVDRAADAVDTLDSLMSGNTDSLLGGNRRLQECFATLYALRNSRQTMTVATKYKTYTSMALVSVRPSRTPVEGAALVFTLTFRYVRIVSSQMTRVPEGMTGKPADMGDAATKQRAQGTVNAGPSKGTELSMDQVSKQAEKSAGRMISGLAAAWKGVFGG